MVNAHESVHHNEGLGTKLYACSVLSFCLLQCNFAGLLVSPQSLFAPLPDTVGKQLIVICTSLKIDDHHYWLCILNTIASSITTKTLLLGWHFDWMLQPASWWERCLETIERQTADFDAKCEDDYHELLSFYVAQQWTSSKRSKRPRIFISGITRTMVTHGYIQVVM